MAAAVLVVMVAGVDLARWRLAGGARAIAVAAWLAGVLAVAIAGAGLDPWWAACAAVGAAIWTALRGGVGADAAALALVVVSAALVLAGDGPDEAAAVAAAAAVAVLLTHAANDVCRAVIARARIEGDLDDSLAPPPRLRGGRFIGPLERWLIGGLALVGAQAVVVGLMAAKGIGRFPEISGDRGRGSAAEEFLVGSLVSWALAGVGALLIAVLRP